MRSSLEELLKPALAETNAAIGRLEAGQVRLESRIDTLGARLDGRIDRLDDKFDRLVVRLDEFGVQQGQLIKDVAGLQRDHETTRDILQRIGRIEERLLRN